MRRAVVLLLVPLALLGPALLPGKRFLPLLPAALEPLAAEDPQAAERAREHANYLAVDRLFPILSDELAARATLARGELPLWEPGLGLGQPLFAATIAGFLYPPNLLALPFDPVLAGGWLAFGSLFLAGLGLWLFLERRGLGFGACAVGALALQVGAFAFTNLHYRMKLDAALWLGWELWAIEGLAERRRGAGPALAGATALSFLAGFPPIALFGALAAALYALARRWLDRRRELPLGRALALIACGAFAASIQLVPALEASRESLRVPQGTAELRAQSLPLATSLTLVAPELFGAPDEAVFAPHLPAAWWFARASEARAAENANLLEWNLFSGAAALCLAIAACVAAWKEARALALLALAALGFAQGWMPLAWLYALPGLDLGAPARAACVSWIALAALASLGAQALIARRPRARAAALATAGVLALAGLGVYLGLEPERWIAAQEGALAARFSVTANEVRDLLGSQAPAAARRIVAAGGWLALAAGALLAVCGFARGRSLAALIALLVAAEGVRAARPHVAPRALGAGELFPPSPALDAVAAAAGGGRVLRLDATASGVGDVLELARPDLPQCYGIADLTPYSVFVPRRLVELVTAVDPGARYRTGISRLSRPELLGHRLYDRLGADALLARGPVEHPRLEPVLEREGFHVYRRRRELPLVRVVPQGVETASDEQALALLAQDLFDPSLAAVLAPGERYEEPARAGPFEGEVRAWSRPASGRTELEVRAPQGGLLVLPQAWYPGWTARIDGEDARLLRVDHAFAALALPAGEALRIELEYRPASLRLGALLSLAGVLGVAWIARGTQKKAGSAVEASPGAP